MTVTDKKILLYKEKPTATLMHKDAEHYVYYCETSAGSIHFHVPVSEMGELPFGETEQAQLLIRWLK